MLRRRDSGSASLDLRNMLRKGLFEHRCLGTER
jgi:hypothetical protein